MRARVTEESKAKRIMMIVRLMARGRWVTAVTGYALQSRWGVATHTMRNYAAEASRFIHEQAMSSEEVRELIKLQLTQAASDFDGDLRANRKGDKTRVDAGRAKVEALRVLAGVEGLDRARANQSDNREAERWRKMTDEELAEDLVNAKRKRKS